MMGAMDHSEVREILEDAAIEPNGLERLMAGDTPTASIVAGHIAGCPECAEALERLHRSVGLIQPTVRAIPPLELKERTMAFVTALGRPRGAAADAATAVSAVSAGESSAARTPTPTPVEAPARPLRTDPHLPDEGFPTAPVIALRPPTGFARFGWVAGLVAALIVAVAGTGLVLTTNHDATTRVLSAQAEALGRVTRSAVRVDAQPDVRRVALAGANGSTATGTLVFSPASTELVVVAEGLTPAAAGREYRCWVEVDGARAPIGKMFFGGGLAYWAGEVSAIAKVAPGARFGVTLVDLAPTSEPGMDVLVSRD